MNLLGNSKFIDNALNKDNIDGEKLCRKWKKKKGKKIYERVDEQVILSQSNNDNTKYLTVKFWQFIGLEKKFLISPS